MKYYLKAFKNYVKFSGRARRKEYWMFILFHVLILIILLLLAGVIEDVSSSLDTADLGFTIVAIYFFATLLPFLALIVRRLHDTNKGWWFIFIYLIPFGGLILLYFLTSDGTRGLNKYGQDPKGYHIALDQFGEEENLDL